MKNISLPFHLWAQELYQFFCFLLLLYTTYKLYKSWKTKKIQVDPESRRLVERTVQRWPRVPEKTSFQRRLCTLENVFDREMKSECIQIQPRLPRVWSRPWVSEKTSFQRSLHFREDWVLWGTFSIGKWRVNVFKANHAFEEFEDDHEFQRRLHNREDWVLWRTFSIGKWRVNVFKANHAFEEFEDNHGFQRRLHFREDWVLWRTFSLSGEMKSECFQSQPRLPRVRSQPRVSEKTSFQRRLGTLENVFDREMRSECIQSQPRLRRVRRRPRVLEKTSFQKRLGTLENVFDWEMKSECIQSQPCLRRVRRRPWVSEKTSFQIKFHFREVKFQCKYIFQYNQHSIKSKYISNCKLYIKM